MMTEEDSIKWDNDPFALKKTEEVLYRRMIMCYNYLKSIKEPEDSQYAVKMSRGHPVSYAEWLKSHGED